MRCRRPCALRSHLHPSVPAHAPARPHTQASRAPEPCAARGARMVEAARAARPASHPITSTLRRPNLRIVSSPSSYAIVCAGRLAAAASARAPGTSAASPPPCPHKPPPLTQPKNWNCAQTRGTAAFNQHAVSGGARGGACAAGASVAVAAPGAAAHARCARSSSVLRGRVAGVPARSARRSTVRAWT